MNLHDVMNASTVIALLYAAAAVLCVMVDNAGTAANAAQTPSDFWRWAAIALLLMAISKLLQLDVAFVLWVREKARNGGWYAMRRLIQLMFIATLIAAILGLGWHALQRKALLVQLQFRHSQILAGTGLGLLVMLLAMRYISFHYLDQLLNARLSDLRVGRLGEIGGLTLVSLVLLFNCCVDAEMFDDIRADFNAHGRKWGAQGFWALAVYRFGRWRYQIGSPVLRKPFSALYHVLYKCVQILTGIELPCEVPVGAGLIIEHSGGIVISGFASFGDNCRIRNGVVIGLSRVEEPFAPQLGNDVDVGAGAKLLGNIRIGNNVRIGANAVVITDVPDNCIAVGVPAVVKPRKCKQAR